MTEANMKRSRWWLALVAAAWLLQSGQAVANECFDVLPEQAVKHGELKICQSAFSGVSEEYSCQEYRGPHGQYRVLYKGGLIPKAVTYFDAKDNEQLVWSTTYGDAKRICPLTPPSGIPADAEHRGTGVCHADDDAAVPCSVYEYAAARQPDFHRYIVFYNPTGHGYYHVNGYVAGDNKNAMVAELAYQLGMSLLDTECCSGQAMEYLEYAYRLFPEADEYSKAYNRARSLLAVRDSRETIR